VILADPGCRSFCVRSPDRLCCPFFPSELVVHPAFRSLRALKAHLLQCTLEWSSDFLAGPAATLVPAGSAPSLSPLPLPPQGPREPARTAAAARDEGDEVEALREMGRMLGQDTSLFTFNPLLRHQREQHMVCTVVGRGEEDGQVGWKEGFPNEPIAATSPRMVPLAGEEPSVQRRSLVFVPE